MLERALAGLVVIPFVLGAAAAPVHRADVVFRFQDPDIVEASALVAADGLVYTSNDSGDTGRVFAVDPASGRTVGVTHWEDDPTDVESLAPGPHGTVWVGDIGDNLGSRDTIQVAEVPVGRGDRTVHPTVYDLHYPDGAQDAETLVRNPASGRLYIASKGVFGGTLYALPARLRANATNRLTPVGRVLPIATDGAFFPDGKHLIVRNYQVAQIYDFPSLTRVATVRLPAQPQGEGISVDTQGNVLVSSEGRRSAVLSVRLPSRVRDVVMPRDPSATAASTPTARPTAQPAAAEDATVDRPAWPWFVVGLVALGAVGMLVRTLRRR